MSDLARAPVVVENRLSRCLAAVEATQARFTDDAPVCSQISMAGEDEAVIEVPMADLTDPGARAIVKSMCSLLMAHESNLHKTPDLGIYSKGNRHTAVFAGRAAVHPGGPADPPGFIVVRGSTNVHPDNCTKITGDTRRAISSVLRFLKPRPLQLNEVAIGFVGEPSVTIEAMFTTPGAPAQLLDDLSDASPEIRYHETSRTIDMSDHYYAATFSDLGVSFRVTEIRGSNH